MITSLSLPLKKHDRLFGNLSHCNKCEIPLANRKRNYEYDYETEIVIAYCGKCLEQLVTNNGHLPVCPICNKPKHRLVSHHWFSPPDYLMSKLDVCDSCNSKLKPDRMWGVNGNRRRGKAEWMGHVLPPLDIQKIFINDYPKYCALMLEYSWPLPAPQILSRHKARGPGRRSLPVREIIDGVPELWYPVTEIGRNHKAVR